MVFELQPFDTTKQAREKRRSEALLGIWRSREEYWLNVSTDEVAGKVEFVC